MLDWPRGSTPSRQPWRVSKRLRVNHDTADAARLGASTPTRASTCLPENAMGMLTRSLMTAAVSVCAAVAPALGQVTVNGGAPNGGAGWNIFDDNRAASVFSLSGSTSFNAIRFWGILFQNAPYTPDIFWQILRDDGGSPGTSVALEGNAVADATLRTELASSPGAFSWQFDLATGARTLSDGVYWLALHDGPLDPGGFTGSSLIWETTAAPGAYDIQTFSIDNTWSPGAPAGLAFDLRTMPVVATPEPASVILLASGLLSIGGVAARRRRRTRDISAVALMPGASSKDQSWL